jgi:ubiquinone/menaquinone biosynthesis C-methylase UbiE
MGRMMNFFTPLHKRTSRDFIGRMSDSKVECMKVARKYAQEFWDGDRRFGYGGYKYDSRWEPVALEIIDKYGLTSSSSILDIGCGKAFLLYELKKLLPEARVCGFDISEYAIANAKEEIRDSLFVFNAASPLPFGDQEFDLAISLGTFHNLHIHELAVALPEMQRVARQGYLMLESYRNELELFNLECWALTCASFHTPQDWIWLYEHFGYSGDYEFIYFE